MHKAFAGFFAATTLGLSTPTIGVLPGDAQVDITWSTPISPADYVLVEESTNAGASWKQIAQLPGLSTSYLADSLQNGSKYWFRIQFVSNGVPADPSDAVLAEPSGQPDIPTSLAAVGGDSSVSLSWSPTPEGSDVVGYGVDMSTDGGTTWSTVVDNTKTPASNYLVSNLKNNQSYFFRVRAIGFDGVPSDWSDSTSVLIGVLQDNTFTLTGKISDTGVGLVWTKPDMADTLDTFRVELSTDGGMTWAKVVEEDAGTLTANVPYVLGGALYRVIGTSITGQTAMSLVALVQKVDDPNAQIDGSGSTASGTMATPDSTTPTPVGPADGVGTRSTLPAFEVQTKPGRVVNTSIASFAILGLLSGAGAAARAAKRDEDEIALVEGIDYEDLERLDGFEEYGDRSKTWRLPNTRWTLRAERLTHAIASAANKVSPAIARMVTDGSYLRAMYGALALTTWIAGLGLAILTLLQTHGEALPPKPLTLLGLLFIGILDSGAGLFASLVVLIGTAATGGIFSAPEARTSIGLVLLWVAPALIASAARPMRRPRPITFDINDESKWQWERAGDFVIGPLLAAFAVRTLLNGLSALAGLQLPISRYSTQFALLALFFVLLRYGMEEQASNNYPMRLRMVEANELSLPFSIQRPISLVLRLALFIFVALPFMGNAWQLYVGALLFITPGVLGLFSSSLPKFPSLFRIAPSGFPQFTLALYVGAAYSAWISTLLHGAAAARMGFLLLSIPTFALSILQKFSGEHEGVQPWYMRDNFKWIYRIGAIYLVASAAYLALR